MGEEFTSFGEESKYRILGKMTDESLKVITALWSGEPVNHKGRYYTVDNVTFQPTPVQKPRIPIWIGANKTPALKRAAKYDGWITVGPCPSVGDPGLSFKKVSEKLKYLKDLRKSQHPFDLVYAFEFPETSMDKFIAEANTTEVTWMLDIISAMRFTGDEALDYIRRGPPI